MGVLDGIHPSFLDNVPSVAFPYTATVYGPTKTTNADGQQRRTYTVPLYSDIPCRKVPSVLTRNMGDEYRGVGGFVRERVDFGVLLKGSYPLVTPECRIMIDSVSYKVAAADIDGNGLMTRLHVNDNQPFVE